MTVNRRGASKHRKTENRNKEPDSAESETERETQSPPNARRRRSLCQELSAKINNVKLKMDAGPCRIFKGHRVLAISCLLSLVVIVIYLTKSADATLTFSSFYQVKQYILDTYGTKNSKLTPEFPTRSELSNGKKNHKIRPVGHVPGRFLASGKGKNALTLNTRLFKKSLENDIMMLEKMWNNYTIDTFKAHHLKPLLIERVSGTPGAKKAISFISGALPEFYDIMYDTSIQETALGDNREFKNIIASSNKFAERQFVVACHFDSKYWPIEGEVFIGAVDSAVPCAMMIQMAWNLRENVKNSGNLGLQFYFFDGEEAFKAWTRTDSVYGSRNMVKSFKLIEKTLSNKRLGNRNNEKIRKIDRINCFMLLDLLGHKNPHFSHDRKFSQANDLFTRLTEIEQMPYLESKYKNKNPNKAYFNSRNIGVYQLGIDDDHMPWYREGVRNILHMIPTPFPNGWHTIEDNEENLDYDTIYNLQLIFDTFVVEYLRLLA